MKCRRTESRSALRKLAGQVCDRDLNLVQLGGAENLSELSDLLLSPAGSGEAVPRIDEAFQLHLRLLLPWRLSSFRIDLRAAQSLNSGGRKCESLGNRQRCPTVRKSKRKARERNSPVRWHRV
jgi:hypothetical protein